MPVARSGEDAPPIVIRSIADTLSSFWRLRAEPESSESSGIIWWTSGGHRRPMNGVLALSAADPAGATDRIAATFRASGLPCAWLEGPDPASPDLGVRLLGLGYEALEGSTGWALPLDEARQTIASPPGLLVRHGREAEMGEELARIVGLDSLGLEPSELPSLARLLRPRRQPGADEEAWIALRDGTPVAGLLTHPNGPHVGIFALTTSRAHREEGYATSLLLAAIRDAGARGFRWAIAEAPPAHAAPFRRLGFDEYCDFRRYGWDPRPSSDAPV